MLAGLGDITKLDGRRIDRAAVEKADALLVRSITPVDEQLLSGSAVKFVGTATAGFDHFDHAWLERAGIRWVSAPGCNANSVVEYVLSAILAVDDYWDRLSRGGHLGVIGYGHVGRLLVHRAQGLGIVCRVFDPWLAPAELDSPASLEDVLGCDVISVHASLTREAPWPSFHLLNAERLGLIDSSSLLINASRGPVADDEALLKCLSAGSAPIAVLDVWESEPDIMPELLALARLGTPHIAGHSLDAKLDGARQIVDAMRVAFDLPALERSESADDRPPVEIQPGLTRKEAVRHALRKTYHIEKDDRILRAALGVATPEERPGVFDRLRRDYPVRRELAGSTLLGEAGDDATRWLAHAFGCRFKETA